MKIHSNKRSQILKTILGVFAILFFTNCSKDNPTSCLNGSWIQVVASDLEILTTAAAIFGDEPTAQNCNSYKSAIDTYLDALNKIKECVPQSTIGDFNGSLEEATEALSEIDCSGN